MRICENINCNYQGIGLVKDYKYLGIYIDYRFNWIKSIQCDLKYKIVIIYLEALNRLHKPVHFNGEFS